MANRNFGLTWWQWGVVVVLVLIGLVENLTTTPAATPTALAGRVAGGLLSGTLFAYILVRLLAITVRGIIGAFRGSPDDRVDRAEA